MTDGRRPLPRTNAFIAQKLLRGGGRAGRIAASVSNPFRLDGDFHRAGGGRYDRGLLRGLRVNHRSLARRLGLALALCAGAATAAAGPDVAAVCDGNSTACLEQMSAMLSARDALAEPAPKARRPARAPPRPLASKPRLNLDQKLSAPDDSEDQGG
jgi:hypothetical protein